MALLLSLQRNMISVRGMLHNLSEKIIQLSKVSRSVSLVCYFLLSMYSVNAGIPNPEKRVCPTENTSTDLSCLKPSGIESMMVDPVITVRFSNPRYYCDSSRYHVDVEFQSNTTNKEIFGMNVRFWYEDAKLEFLRFQGFPASYGAVAPSPPIVSPVNVGALYFGLSTVADYVNGAIQKTSTNATPIYISTTGWTKLFTIVFRVDDPNPDFQNFYAAVIGDLRQNPSEGGFLSGSDGIVITLVNPTGGSVPSTENTQPLNWVYQTQTTAPLYGHPVNTTVASFYNCAPPIACPASITIACGNSTLPATLGSATSPDYCIAGTPVISYTDLFSGGTCPQPNLITRIWHAADSCGNHTYCSQYITVGTGYNNCDLLVTNANNTGIGSFRNAVSCAQPGDTVRFHSSLANSVILLNTTKIIFDKNLYIHSSFSPHVIIKSSVAGLFDISAGKSIEFKDVDIVSGLATGNNDGAAFNNLGSLKLINVKVYRNPSLPAGQYLIRNKPGSQFSLMGNCFIQNN